MYDTYQYGSELTVVLTVAMQGLLHQNTSGSNIGLTLERKLYCLINYVTQIQDLLYFELSGRVGFESGYAARIRLTVGLAKFVGYVGVQMIVDDVGIEHENVGYPCYGEGDNEKDNVLSSTYEASHSNDGLNVFVPGDLPPHKYGFLSSCAHSGASTGSISFATCTGLSGHHALS